MGHLRQVPTTRRRNRKEGRRPILHPLYLVHQFTDGCLYVCGGLKRVSQVERFQQPLKCRSICTLPRGLRWYWLQATQCVRATFGDQLSVDKICGTRAPLHLQSNMEQSFSGFSYCVFMRRIDAGLTIKNEVCVLCTRTVDTSGGFTSRLSRLKPGTLIKTYRILEANAPQIIVDAPNLNVEEHPPKMTLAWVAQQQ
ncbi:hypothetical protein EVAR_55822_1 [Eumeta japonica]|uniref:Uncharacterized protein n=1 Tax=Eumeta variegata TaxID=151549 RepID=A0A4C1ZDK5_EUMVA|nr:hypothetical protein EVAR_55822_1 [Eumeta japonica]